MLPGCSHEALCLRGACRKLLLGRQATPPPTGIITQTLKPKTQLWFQSPCRAVADKLTFSVQASGWMQQGLQALGAEVPNEARQRFHHEMMQANDSKAAKQAVRGLYRAPKPN